MKPKVETHRSTTGRIVTGWLLEPGDVLLATDVFEASDGSWQQCPIPNTQIGPFHSRWVRPGPTLGFPSGPQVSFSPIRAVYVSCKVTCVSETGAEPDPRTPKALEHINKHRARFGQRPLDPVTAGWLDSDIVIEAERLGWRAKVPA